MLPSYKTFYAIGILNYTLNIKKKSWLLNEWMNYTSWLDVGLEERPINWYHLSHFFRSKFPFFMGEGKHHYGCVGHWCNRKATRESPAPAAAPPRRALRSPAPPTSRRPKAVPPREAASCRRTPAGEEPTAQAWVAEPSVYLSEWENRGRHVRNRWTSLMGAEQFIHAKSQAIDERATSQNLDCVYFSSCMDFDGNAAGWGLGLIFQAP